MNSRTKTALVVCLAVSIFAGFVPWFSQAHAEFKIFSQFPLEGSFTCNGNINTGTLKFLARADVGPDDTGSVVIHVPKEAGFFGTGRSYFYGKVTDVQVSSDSFTISAVINQNFCDRLTTLIELSPCERGCPRDTPRDLPTHAFRDLSCDGWREERVGIQYRGKAVGGPFEDRGLFSGIIFCEDKPGSSIQNPGTSQSDTITGTNANNLIDGKEGNDILRGLDGNDIIIGGEGRDLLVGGDGNDELRGGPGPDTFSCGSGTDKIIDFKPSEGDKKTSDCEQF